MFNRFWEDLLKLHSSGAIDSEHSSQPNSPESSNKNSEVDEIEQSQDNTGRHKTVSASSGGETTLTTNPSTETEYNAPIAPLSDDPETMLEVQADLSRGWNLMISRTNSHQNQPSTETEYNAPIAPISDDPETMREVQADLSRGWNLMISRTNSHQNQNQR